MEKVPRNYWERVISVFPFATKIMQSFLLQRGPTCIPRSDLDFPVEQLLSIEISLSL